MNIVDHKFEGVPFVPTQKMNGIYTPKLIVLHFTAGWTTEGDIFTLAKSDRKASAHVVLSREGKWTQIVPFNRIAWHAGPSKWKGFVGLNDDSIGIEVSNIGYLKKFSDGTYKDEYNNVLDGDGNFLNSKRKAHSAPKFWHEYYNKILTPGKYVWEPFYAPQLDALEDGVRAMIKAYPSITEIVTHEDIDTRGWKTDINGGRMFPMKRFVDLVGDKTYKYEEPLTAAIVDTKSIVPPKIAPPLVNNDQPVIAALPPAAEVKIIKSDETWALIELAGGLKGWFPRLGLRVG